MKSLLIKLHESFFNNIGTFNKKNIEKAKGIFTDYLKYLRNDEDTWMKYASIHRDNSSESVNVARNIINEFPINFGFKISSKDCVCYYIRNEQGNMDWEDQEGDRFEVSYNYNSGAGLKPGAMTYALMHGDLDRKEWVLVYRVSKGTKDDFGQFYEIAKAQNLASRDANQIKLKDL